MIVKFVRVHALVQMHLYECIRMQSYEPICRDFVKQYGVSIISDCMLRPRPNCHK